MAAEPTNDTPGPDAPRASGRRSSLVEDAAALFAALGPHGLGLLAHLLPHTPPLMIKMLDLVLRPSEQKGGHDDP